MADGDREIRWLPLESNPDVINKYLAKWGISGDWSVVDVYGCDPEMLAIVPKPVSAVFLLYPITEKSEAHQKDVVQKLKEDKFEKPSGLYFAKQSIGNACGTIALIHAVGNSGNRIDLGDGVFKKFFESTKSMAPDDICKSLEANQSMTSAHEDSAQEGQTKAPSRDDKVNLHFICFVNHDNCLYEMDGRQELPIKHGATTNETLLEDAAKVCQEFIGRDPTNLSFTMMALSAGKMD